MISSFLKADSVLKQSSIKGTVTHLHLMTRYDYFSASMAGLSGSKPVFNSRENPISTLLPHILLLCPQD